LYLRRRVALSSENPLADFDLNWYFLLDFGTKAVLNQSSIKAVMLDIATLT
jgi:hypothetical protein